MFSCLLNSSRDGGFTFLGSCFQCLSTFLQRNSCWCPTWSSLANARRRFWSTKAGLTSLQRASPRNSRNPGRWAVHPSHFHSPTSKHTTESNRLGFPQRLLQVRISSPLLKGKKWIMESLCVHLLEMSHAESRVQKAQRCFTTKSQTYSSLNEWKSHMLCQKHLFCYTFLCHSTKSNSSKAAVIFISENRSHILTLICHAHVSYWLETGKTRKYYSGKCKLKTLCNARIYLQLQ